MFEWSRDRRERKRRDRNEAQYLVTRHGDRALEILTARAADPDLDARSRAHWRRIAKLVAQMSRG